MCLLGTTTKTLLLLSSPHSVPVWCKSLSTFLGFCSPHQVCHQIRTLPLSLHGNRWSLSSYLDAVLRIQMNCLEYTGTYYCKTSAMQLEGCSSTNRTAQWNSYLTILASFHSFPVRACLDKKTENEKNSLMETTEYPRLSLQGFLYPGKKILPFSNYPCFQLS